MSESPARRIRIDDDTWKKIQDEAAKTRETASGYIRRIVIEHMEKNR